MRVAAAGPEALHKSLILGLKITSKSSTGEAIQAALQQGGCFEYQSTPNAGLTQAQLSQTSTAATELGFHSESNGSPLKWGGLHQLFLFVARLVPYPVLDPPAIFKPENGLESLPNPTRLGVQS